MKRELEWVMDQAGRKPESEQEGPFWTHPYFWYIVLTGMLFGFLLIMGWVALTNGWIPQRSV